MMNIRVITFLLLLVAISCDSENKTTTSESPENQTPQKTETVGRFVGVIRATQILGLGVLGSEEVIYTISENKIRREVVSRDKIDDLFDSENRAGIICDLEKNEVILYCARSNEKHYCKLTIPEYIEAVQSLALNSGHKAYDGVGHLFLGAPATPLMSNYKKEYATIQNHSCDRYEMSFEALNMLVTIETDYCPKIRIDQKMLTLIEPNISPEIKGFPLKIHRYNKKAPNGEGWLKLLDKAADAAVGQLNKILKLKYDFRVTEIKAEGSHKLQFELSDDYIEIPNLSDFDKKFYRPSSSSDFD